jgi:hypothetical protein
MPGSAGEDPVRAVGSRWELFVDDWLIERFDGAELRLHAPEPREAVFRFEAPWEGPACAYVTLLEHEQQYRMYYRASANTKPDEAQLTAVAISHDGLQWERPILGHIEWQGSTANNVVWAGGLSHNFTPVVDASPHVSAAERFKALAGLSTPGHPTMPRGLVALASPDGYRWRRVSAAPVLSDGLFDSQNVAFWDPWEGQYVAYYRDFVGGHPGGIRGIKRAASPDFVHWAAGEWLEYGNAPLEHLYTNTVTPYPRANRLYLAFPRRFFPERKALPEHPVSGVSDAVFMSSRDGRRWDRRFMEAFLRPGLDQENWTSRSNTIAWGLVQTGPSEMSLYWSEHQALPTLRLRRGTVRLDGFASLSAGYAGGEAVTHPLAFAGDDLVLNYATSAAGSVRIELQEADGTPIPGYRLEESPDVYGDSIEHVFRWRDGVSVKEIAGRPVRLRLVLRDADVYALRFRNGASADLGSDHRLV